MPRDERGPGRRARVTGRRIKRHDRTSQLLERGDGPGGPVGSFEGSPSEFTTEGGPGTNTPNRYGGWIRSDYEPPNPRSKNTGGDAGYSTLGGGTFYGEGSYYDAPNSPEWTRRSSGATSGARGREGLSYPGEHTWGEAERRRERGEVTGPHVGRGPRTYQRPDASIYEEICEMLTHHPDLDASDVEVSVEGGEVTLEGTVEDRDVRWLIEDLVESVSGVSLVHNRLRALRR